MTLEVYGCGYNKDIDKYKYSHRAEKTHAQEAKEELEIIVNVLQTVIWQINEKPLSMFNGSQTFKKCLLNLSRYLNECFEDLIQIQNQKIQRQIEEKVLILANDKVSNGI